MPHSPYYKTLTWYVWYFYVECNMCNEDTQFGIHKVVPLIRGWCNRISGSVRDGGRPRRN